MKILPKDIEIYKKIDLKDPVTWVVTWFGCGFIVPGPGTWGSLGSVPFAIFIYYFWGLKALIIAILLVFALGLKTTQIFQDKTQTQDCSLIVIDEVVGQWIALGTAFYLVGLDPYMPIVAFLLFRFFDIFKPWPISWAEKRLHGEVGVMVDDVIAGLFASLCLIGIHYAGFS